MHKGIMLAGGLGTRLQPLTKITSKHLLPVGNEPMMFHSVKQLTEAGITDILIVTNPQYIGDFIRRSFPRHPHPPFAFHQHPVLNLNRERDGIQYFVTEI